MNRKIALAVSLALVLGGAIAIHPERPAGAKEDPARDLYLVNADGTGLMQLTKRFRRLPLRATERARAVIVRGVRRRTRVSRTSGTRYHGRWYGRRCRG